MKNRKITKEKMKVKLFDRGCDLDKKINSFIEDKIVIDIKISGSPKNGDMILVIYKDIKKFSDC